MLDPISRQCLTAITLLLFNGTVAAGNGLNDSATGVQSAGLANADLVLANNTAALNINPAGLSRIEGSHLDLMVEPVLWSVRHQDSLGNDAKPANETVFVVGGGYARRLNPEWVAGIGMFFQGGAGFEYENLNNPFGPPDDVGGLFGSLKIAPGVSWQVNDRLTLGASVGLLYSTAEQEVYPNTSSAQFQGLRIDDLKGISGNFRLGLLYQLSPRWTLGANYSSEAAIRLKDGSLSLNRAASGQTPLTYENVSIKGLNFAEEIGLGVTWQPVEPWTIAVDVAWLDWSSAMRFSRLTAREPDDASAAPVLVMDTPAQWRDHVLVSVGTEYRLNSKTLLRAGVSHARSPQQDIGLSPSNNLLADLTIGAGFTHHLGERWEASASMVWQPDRSENYTNPLFGDARETFGAYAWYLGLARRW